MPEFFKTVENCKSFSDFITEQSLAELKDRPHGEGKVEKVDVLVPHGQVLLADAEHLGALLRCPDAQVTQSQA